jgi:hypothetical protein
MSEGNPETQPTDVPVESEAQPTDPNSLFADQLADIKAPDGRQKYADVPTALNSIPYQDDKIREQTDRIRELEAELAKKQGVDEVLEQLQSQQAPVEQPSSAGIDETTIATLIDQRLQQSQIEAKANANASQVLNQLNELYGDKAEEQFNSKAASLGMSVQQLSDLARQAPQAALAFFDKPASNFDKPASNPVNPTTGSLNTSVLQPQQSAPPKPDIFNGGTSSSLASWRAAAKKEE